MAYKLKIKHTPYQNKGTIGYLERLSWKKEKSALRYRDNVVPDAEVVKV
jgi:hypothetical protein